MDFELSSVQKELVAGIRDTMRAFPAKYWRDKDEKGEWPHEFVAAMANGGWLGVAMPEAYGGAGLGITEAALVVGEITASGAGLTGASAVHINMFGVNPLVKHGTEEQRQKYLPDIISGKLRCAFGVTEPNAGLDTSRITTRAVRKGDKWIVNGHKVWISTAQHADRLLLVARTTPYEEVTRKTDGITLFFAPLDRERITVTEIHKCGRAAVDSNELFIENLEISNDDVIGEVGKGFNYLLDGLNPERILVAAEAVGMGRAALAIATKYAKERVVFNRPIGMNQGVQFPLARSYAELELANTMVMKAAWLYDNGKPCGAEANISKLMGAEYGFAACDRAMQTLGGYGYAKEFDVERLWRECKISRIAPVSPELIQCYLAERVLGLPKSY